MSDVFAPFTLPLRRQADAMIVDANGKTVLIVDPDRDIEEDQAEAITDQVFALLAAAPAVGVGATLRHHDGRTGTFVCIEVDGRSRVQSLKGKGFWVFHPDDCEQLRSGAAPDARRAVADIAAERQRQIDAEGCSEDRDDRYTEGEMARAAVAYALAGSGYDHAAAREMWPARWHFSWWKPTTPRRDLVKAGALIVAEIERLDRQAFAALQAEQEGGAA